MIEGSEAEKVTGDKMEIVRIFTDKKLLKIMIALLLINIIWVFFSEQWECSFNYGSIREKQTILREIEESVKQMSTAEAADYLAKEEEELLERIYAYEDGDELLRQKDSFRYYVVEKERKQYEYAAEYQEYIGGVLGQAEQMSGISIFAKEGGFAAENINKTAKDYKKLQNLEIQPGKSIGLEMVLKDILVHIIVLIFGCVLALHIVNEEYLEMRLLIYSTQSGRLRLRIKQLIALFAGTFIFSVVAFVSRFAVGEFLYGGVFQWNRPVQSSQMFQYFTGKITQGEFLCGYTVACAVTMCCVTFFVWVVLLAEEKKVIAFLEIFVVFGVEWICYQFIQEQSYFAILKFCNLYSYIDPTSQLVGYRNINLVLGLALSGTVLLISSILFMFLFMGIACWIGARQKPIHVQGRIHRIVGTVLGKVQRWSYALLTRLHFIGMELYRIFILRRGIIVLIVAVVYLLKVWNGHAVYYSNKTYIVQAFCENHREPIDDSTRKDLEECLEQAKNDDETSAYSELLYKLSKVEQLKEETGRDQWLVEELPYEFLIGNLGSGRRNQVAIVISAILIFIGAALYTKGKTENIDSLINCTERGTVYVTRIRRRICYAMIVLLAGSSMVIDYYYVAKTYGWVGLKISLDSLLFAESRFYHGSLLVMMVLLFIIKMGTMFGMMMIMEFISRKFSTSKTIAVCLVLCYGPMFLEQAGITAVKYVNVMHLLQGIELFIKESTIWN